MIFCKDCERYIEGDPDIEDEDHPRCPECQQEFENDKLIESNSK